ncbi:MAG: hypothetical protein ACM3KE_06540 [Hyphomicrobiales bacterium]
MFSGTSPAGPDASLSFGDYFEAVRSFIEGAGSDAIGRTLADWGADASSAEILRIFLAKHGEYYHPARVEAQIKEELFHWVVNVAVSPAGRSLLFKEYAILERLSREFRTSYLPQVYGAGEVVAGRGHPVAMFLGQWFGGFHEFHLTRDAPEEKPALVLWDAENGHRRLDRNQARRVYHQVARILTHYFSLTTSEGIGAWHHAAGDFVIRLRGADPEARLITVRAYRPVFRARPNSGDPDHNLKTLLEMLLIFLLNLSIRTRLDRLDGTGAMAWSDPVAVEATVAGMLAGLAGKPPPFGLALPVDQLFRHYLAACSAEDVLDLCNGIANTYPPEAPETPVVRARLEEHATALSDALGQL